PVSPPIRPTPHLVELVPVMHGHIRERLSACVYEIGADSEHIGCLGRTSMHVEADTGAFVWRVACGKGRIQAWVLVGVAKATDVEHPHAAGFSNKVRGVDV